MSLDYKNWSYGDTSISSDTDTVERALMSGEVKVEAPSASDLKWALEWLAIYQSSDHKELAQAFGNVIAFLDLTAQSKEKRSNLAQAKKKFAEANGIPVSQVRINRNN
jgi:flagellar biosynthesis component FlhA